VFLVGTTCRDLVSKLGRKTPTRASELMDIATKFASGQEAVEAIFRKDKQPQGRQPEDIPEASTQRGTKKKNKKKSQAKRDAADADLVAAAEYKNPRKPPGGANLFDKMLKESCPYHQGPVKHTLEECVMLRRHFHRAEPPAEGGRAHNNNKKEDHKAEEFPEVHDCFMIYGGQVANALAWHHKQERREVCSVKVAVPVYLDWSDKPITFDQGDHPDRVPSPGKYPLVVDPVIGYVRLTKVLMDGDSSLNIIYAETLGLHVSEWGIEANPEKIVAITNMGPIKDLKGVQRVMGCLAALSRFISRLGERGLLLYHLLRKTECFTWTPETEEALGNLKALLTNAPILVPPRCRRSPLDLRRRYHSGGQRRDRG
jgi:hypothetical protein